MFDNPTALLKTIKCKVVTIASSKDGYNVLIVETKDSEYLPITIPFNFEFNLKVNDEGMLTYEEAIAGLTKWWSKEEERYYVHNYTAYYYKHFLHHVGSTDSIDNLYIS